MVNCLSIFGAAMKAVLDRNQLIEKNQRPEKGVGFFVANSQLKLYFRKEVMNKCEDSC